MGQREEASSRQEAYGCGLALTISALFGICAWLGGAYGPRAGWLSALIVALCLGLFLMTAAIKNW